MSLINVHARLLILGSKCAKIEKFWPQKFNFQGNLRFFLLYFGNLHSTTFKRINKLKHCLIDGEIELNGRSC